MTNCPRCEAMVDTNDRFCGHCGLKLSRRTTWKNIVTGKMRFPTKKDVESWIDGYYIGDGT